MHPNKIVRNIIINELKPNNQCFLIEPLKYYELIYAMKKCFLVLTDSGGNPYNSKR